LYFSPDIIHVITSRGMGRTEYVAGTYIVFMAKREVATWKT